VDVIFETSYQKKEKEREKKIEQIVHRKKTYIKSILDFWNKFLLPRVQVTKVTTCCA